jgi:hypothetical protein
MTEITVTQLKEILEGINSPTFISMLTNTPVDMNKYLNFWIVDENGKKKKNPNPTINPYFNGIRNISRKYKIITGFDYEKSVNRRRENEKVEPNFESQGNWFENISLGLVKHNTQEKYYIRYQYLTDSTLSTTYIYQNDEIGKELFEQFMKPVSDYSSQGVDNTCKFQVCCLDNILEISINKEQYKIIHKQIEMV